MLSTDTTAVSPCPLLPLLSLNVEPGDWDAGQGARPTIKGETWATCTRRRGETVDGAGDSHTHGGERHSRAGRGTEIIAKIKIRSRGALFRQTDTRLRSGLPLSCCCMLSTSSRRLTISRQGKILGGWARCLVLTGGKLGIREGVCKSSHATIIQARDSSIKNPRLNFQFFRFSKAKV